MPKLKRSKGEAKLTTVYGELFTTWLWAEIENSADWNPNLVMVRARNYIKFPYATFFRHAKYIKVYSKNPVLAIHARLKIRMGDGKLELT